MPEMHLRQPGFNYSPCGTFAKNKERIQKFRETGDSRYICQNKLDKAFFHHDMAMEILRSCQQEQLLINYYVLKRLILLKIQIIMVIKEVLLSITK